LISSIGLSDGQYDLSRDGSSIGTVVHAGQGQVRLGTHGSSSIRDKDINVGYGLQVSVVLLLIAVNTRSKLGHAATGNSFGIQPIAIKRFILIHKVTIQDFRDVSVPVHSNRHVVSAVIRSYRSVKKKIRENGERSQPSSIN
jgi:hypothetical protein